MRIGLHAPVSGGALRVNPQVAKRPLEEALQNDPLAGWRLSGRHTCRMPRADSVQLSAMVGAM